MPRCYARSRHNEESRVSSDVEQKWQLWLHNNVHNIPSLSDADAFNEEIERLRQTAERDLGRLIPEIEDQLGDLNDLIRDAYESVHDPELGFKDPSLRSYSRLGSSCLSF